MISLTGGEVLDLIQQTASRPISGARYKSERKSLGMATSREIATG